MAEATPIVLTPGLAVGATLDDEKQWPMDVNEVPIPVFDTGVFITELINNDMLPKMFENPLTEDEKSSLQDNPEVLLERAKNDANRADQLLEGTYCGTQLALTKIYDLIKKKYGSFMDTANFEPTVPSPLSLDQKKQFFAFTDPKTDNFPPHLNLAANKDANGVMPKHQGSALSPGDLFNTLRLAQLTALIPAVVPKNFIGRAGAKVGKKLIRNDIFDLPNIGNLSDWYSDARFAPQFFTGTNPTTIEKAGKWVRIFVDAATDPKDSGMKSKISKRASESPESLYVQDYSYIRKSAGTDDLRRAIRCCVRVLVHLADNGKLEPIAIIIDWRGKDEDPKDSVFIYNRELNTVEQKEDWAWRYAKTCVQSSDWIRHTLTVHLTRTHLIEESAIVTAHRTLPQDHDVFQLLYPHWQKTLSLNAAARSVLIPYVIASLMGMEEGPTYQCIRSEYYDFDFQGSYIPEDLRRRGFPPEKINDNRYHNYAWARCILSMWFKIRRYVKTMLSLRYTGQDPDLEVRNDSAVQNWSKEMRAPVGTGDGAQITRFLELNSLDDLIDTVTMCIHIASPQHTSVNYLQNYYQAFVPNKPPCLYTAPPTTREELLGYTEADLVAALPMNQPHDWLLASHIPYLLSFKPGDKESLIIDKERKIAAAAARFYQDLAESQGEFRAYGEDTDGRSITYNVLSPDWNAVSILI
ncbi:Uu.00g010490.m01.CDS01 [Anthostomella pinea]|uniref:Manganese lipoxygenase n=1 Tax=Anthostomella pinea TaxID=933095 RepID=A0AAI8VYH0_9PEZI|nr:Uu.00g010490.m01.CDS01 [Anthostomella pinea]